MAQEVFNTSGTFEVPAGVTEITVECWGGGGGTLASAQSIAGAGGGAYARSVLNVTPLDQHTVTVGAGGDNTNSAAGDGGASSFDSIVIAAGGVRGAGSPGDGGQASSSTGDVKFSGGSGGARSSLQSGGGGGSATATGNGGNGVAGDNTLGAGAGGIGDGNGGNGGTDGVAGSGQDGFAPGGGAGGNARGTGGPGQFGAPGRVVITWENPPDVTDGPDVSYGAFTGAFEGRTGVLSFTVEHAELTDIDWQVRTSTGGTGTLVTSGTATSGVPVQTEIEYDAPGIVQGSQTLYLRVLGNTSAEDNAFTFNVLLATQVEHTFVWQVGLLESESSLEIVWGQGGSAYTERAIVWEVAPAPTRVTYALTGETGPTRFNMRYRRVTPTGLFLQDVSNAFTGYPRISSNNDRQVFRVASFTIDPDATDDLGNPITLRPFVDQVAVSMDLLVDGDYWLNIPMGTYAIQAPTRFMTTRGEDWQIEAPDLTIRLVEQMTDSLYVVPESTNYITAVRDIFDLLGLPHNFPPTEAVTIKDETYLPATPWVTVVNDLLQKAGYYIHWFDRRGRATSRQLGDVSTRTPDVAYTGNDFLLSSITEEVETTRFANQIIVTAESPDQDGLVVVATNNDPDSPVSTVNLGYIRSKVIPMSGATLEAMEEKAAYELSQSDSVYTRSTIETLIDPRRDGREVYNVDAPWADYNDRWQVRNTDVDLRPGGVMRHVLSKVRRVMADIETVGGE